MLKKTERIIHNYHTHTWRCRHAEGAEEEYIKRAIDNGIKYMGFSDHVPFVCSDGSESSFRVPVCEAKEYILELRQLREKYKEQIDIKIGFEMEYYPAQFRDMLKNAVEFGGEYLILGQHYFCDESLNDKPTILKNDSIEELKEYTSLVTEAIESGVFTYVAHPDIFNFIGDVSVYCEEIRKICIASREKNIPLEINCLGIRTKRNYPNEVFWQIAGEEKAPVTVGFDAHDTKNAFDGESYVKAMKMVEKYNLNYIGIPKLINLLCF